MTAGGSRRIALSKRSFDLEFFGGAPRLDPFFEPFRGAAVAVPGDVGILGVAVFRWFLARIPFFFLAFEQTQGFVERDAHFFGELGHASFELRPGFTAAPFEFMFDVFFELFQFFDRERGEIHDVFRMKWKKPQL